MEHIDIEGALWASECTQDDCAGVRRFQFGALGEGHVDVVAFVGGAVEVVHGDLIGGAVGDDFVLEEA